MSERIGVIRRALLLPADDLALEFTKAGYYGLGDDIQLGLSLIYGIGPNAPRLLTVDDLGRIVLAPGNLGQQVQINDALGTGVVRAVPTNADNHSATDVTLETSASLFLSDGSNTWKRARQAGIGVMQAQAGIGAMLTTPPGMWSVVSTPAAGVQASASKAAGAAGVAHVCTGILITHGAIAAPVATAGQWVLRDGATGAGTILAAGQVAIPAAVFQGTPFLLSGLAIPGTAATAMTLEFTAGLANLLEGCTLFGYDVA